jgi:hypothetical protein
MSARVLFRAASVPARSSIVTTASMFVLSLVVALRTQAEGKSAAESPTLKRILHTWKIRAERTRSLHFTSRAYLPTSLEGSIPFRVEFWLQGEYHFRYEMAIADPNPRLSSIGHRRSFDGIRSANTTWVSSNLAEPPNGIISKGIDDSAPGDEKLIPVLLMFRPFRRGSRTVQPDDFRLVTENAIRDNRHFVKLQRLNENGVTIENFWVDSSRDDIIAFWGQVPATPDSECAVEDLSIRYQIDPKHGWIPTEWALAANSDSRSRRIVVGVSQLTINEELAPSTFAPSFPPGTRVVDEMTGEVYDVAPDGSKPPAADLKIYKALETKSDFTFDPQPLRSALDRIQEHFNIRVAIDKKRFSEAAIDPEMEVAGRIPGIRLRDLLDRIMGQCPKPVRYQVRDGVLVIEPRPRSKGLPSIAGVRAPGKEAQQKGSAK